jgi:predicted negative regulator of RcsB-dependent stress response
MNGLLKLLIAAACIVVIAGSGYLGWREWQAAEARQVAETRALAGAECRAELRKDVPTEAKIASCLFTGHLTQADLDRRIKEARAGD